MTTQIELDEFRADVRAWLADSMPADPGFLLPKRSWRWGLISNSSFCVTGSELFTSWVSRVGLALGVRGRRSNPGLSGYCESGNGEGTLSVCADTIGLNWAGPLILDMGSEEDKQHILRTSSVLKTFGVRGFLS